MTAPNQHHRTVVLLQMSSSARCYVLMVLANCNLSFFFRIVLPSFNREGEHCLSFHYNMNGFHINTLHVVKRTTSGEQVNLWKKKGHQGPQWHGGQVTVDLHRYDQVSTPVNMSKLVPYLIMISMMMIKNTVYFFFVAITSIACCWSNEGESFLK